MHETAVESPVWLNEANELPLLGSCDGVYDDGGWQFMC